MRKLKLIITVLLLVLLSTANVQAETKHIKLKVNGQDYPFLLIRDFDNGALMASLSGIDGLVGIPVWNKTENSVRFSLNDQTVTMVIDGPVTENGKQVEYPAPARIINGQLKLPLEALLTSLGGRVFWESEAKDVLNITLNLPEYDTDNEYIENFSGGLYQNDYMGINVVLPQGTVIAPEGSDNVITYIKGLGAKDEEEVYAILAVLALPEAKSIFGDKPGEDLMMQYLQNAAMQPDLFELAKKQSLTEDEYLKASLKAMYEYGQYDEGDLTILNADTVGLLGNNARQIECYFLSREDPLEKKRIPHYFITSGTTIDNVYYQAILTSTDEKLFREWRADYQKVLETLNITGNPVVINPLLVANQPDVEALLNLPPQQYSTLKPLIESGCFTPSSAVGKITWQQRDPQKDSGVKEYASMNLKNSSVGISIDLCSGLAEAKEQFKDAVEFNKGSCNMTPLYLFAWDNRNYLDDLFTYQQQGDNQSCATFMIQQRTSAEWGSRRLGYNYHSVLIVQVNNMVITMTEWRSEMPVDNKAEAVKVLAGVIAGLE